MKIHRDFLFAGAGLGLLGLLFLALSIPGKAHPKALSQIDDASVFIEMQGAEKVVTCSGTKIAKNLILTAKHCVDDIDDKTVFFVDGLLVKIQKIHLAFEDVAIIKTDDLPFSNFYPKLKQPKHGEKIFIIGNPLDLRGVLRRGYVSTVPNEANDKYLINLPVQMGDSGSAVWNEYGDIVGVISGVLSRNSGGITFQLTVVEPIDLKDVGLMEAFKNDLYLK